jgi:signal transduction histidine kinase
VIVGFDRTTDGPQFTSDDSRLLRAFAASAATAVATAQSVEEERLRATIEASERERGRWARELHDDTLQSLAALQVLHSSALRKGDAESLSSAARKAVEQLSVEITNLRSLISELRPAALDEIGLEPALHGLVGRAASTADLEIETDIELSDHPPLSPEVESAIYRLVQEALTNISKHASASHVWVRVAGLDGQIEVAVRDDGVGFDPGGESQGFGLIGMRERAMIAGGEFEIHSVRDGGTTVRATIPTGGQERQRKAV